MKMTSVIQPQTFLAGVGQYSYDEMLHGLSWLGATEDDLMSGLSGLGRTTYLMADKGKPSVMDAIIRNAAEMNIKTRTLNEERMKAAKADPKFALKLSAAMKKTSVPGTNVAAGVKAASMDAAAKAAQAKVLEAKARILLAQGDKRGAAAEAVNALTKAREALITSTSAEKTRLTVSLDSTAHTLDEQARYVEGQAQNLIARTGPSKNTDSMRAAALHLRTEAGKLRKTSAVVAAAPAVPANAPTQSRIAEVANKFNLRAVGRGTDANVSSVLSDLSESSLAQVRDYEGALKFYGNDNVGRLMCDMEFDNHDAAVKGLAGAVHGVGYIDTLPVFAQADKALAQGVRTAQVGFSSAVLPAYVGAGKALQHAQVAAAQLGGLGRPYAIFVSDAEADKWDRVCNEEYGLQGKTPNDEQLQKCLKPGIGCDLFNPWEAVGRACRGNITIAQAVAQVGTGILKGDVKLPDLSVAGGRATPPASTLPPRTVPTKPAGAYTPGTGGSTGTAAGGYTPGGYSITAPSNTMLYAGIGAGVLALGAGIYWTMFRRPTV